MNDDVGSGHGNSPINGIGVGDVEVVVGQSHHGELVGTNGQSIRLETRVTAQRRPSRENVEQVLTDLAGGASDENANHDGSVARR